MSRSAHLSWRSSCTAPGLRHGRPRTLKPSDDCSRWSGSQISIRRAPSRTVKSGSRCARRAARQARSTPSSQRSRSQTVQCGAVAGRAAPGRAEPSHGPAAGRACRGRGMAVRGDLRGQRGAHRGAEPGWLRAAADVRPRSARPSSPPPASGATICSTRSAPWPVPRPSGLQPAYLSSYRPSSCRGRTPPSSPRSPAASTAPFRGNESHQRGSSGSVSPHSARICAMVLHARVYHPSSPRLTASG